MHKLAEWIDKDVIKKLEFTGYSQMNGYRRKNYRLTLGDGDLTNSFTAFCGEAADFRNGHAVLELVCSDAQYARDMDVGEFSREMGYSGREGEKVYAECKKSLAKLKRLFGEDTDEVIELYTSGEYMEEEDEDGDAE